MLSLLACNRSTGDTTPAVSSATPAASASAPAINAAKYSALGVCNRLLADGAATTCKPDDAGVSVTFTIGPNSAGMVSLAPNDAAFERQMNSMHFDGFRVATSQPNRVIVFWKGANELEDLRIRTTIAGL
jgi:hypothetical protein